MADLHHTKNPSEPETTMTHIYDQHLDRNSANHAPLSPLGFIARTAEVYPERLAVVHGTLRRNWGETYARCRQLASSLNKAGVGKNDTVAVMLPNTPPMVEAHFGVPMAGAVLNALNTRLDAETIAFMLDHGEAKVLIVDPEFTGVVAKALKLRQRSAPLLVIQVEDTLYGPAAEQVGSLDYDDFVAGGDAGFDWQLPADEWDAIALNYTSGTTGNPKGVVYHHRGGHQCHQQCAGVGHAQARRLPVDPAHVPLQRLVLSVDGGGTRGVNVCLRRVEAQAIFDAIRNHGVTHYCGAPIVHGLLVNAPAAMKEGVPAGVKAMVAGAAPPASMIEGMEQLGFDITHVYGLTEVYGPATVCAKHAAWDALDIGERARLNSRQGVRYHLQRSASVLDPETMEPVPHDGQTMGEIMFQGNIAMKGYLKNPQATDEAFRGGWFHTGDLAVQHPDGYIQIKDRSKDIIISGGENISSIEVEDVLYRHPAVLAAAVAKPDPKWGETPCAFIELKAGAQTTAEDIVAHCKKHLAGYKVPRAVVFGELPKTSTGKIQKFELRRQAGSVQAITG